MRVPHFPAALDRRHLTVGCIGQHARVRARRFLRGVQGPVGACSGGKVFVRCGEAVEARLKISRHICRVRARSHGRLQGSLGSVGTLCLQCVVRCRGAQHLAWYVVFWCSASFIVRCVLVLSTFPSFVTGSLLQVACVRVAGTYKVCVRLVPVPAIGEIVCACPFMRSQARACARMACTASLTPKHQAHTWALSLCCSAALSASALRVTVSSRCSMSSSRPCSRQHSWDSPAPSSICRAFIS